ncbi:hypothetical protein [Aminobacter sp. MDW-2]|uniref:hypothetical protein n=1 Tax=Aminobacter sp. MDW-2 TaxID=2666139 RepID=UPI0012AFBC93|nr:hypothetical protein [Aminobacter sp. MDW-2]MRX32829.1 hypothetical protein [Aminobacter sp. MDW-2]QNH34513.1 hypothetical protein H5P29_00730 [Aminobacter sp. MDW-2]
MFSSWSIDMPPTGSTGDKALDKRLSDDFRGLIAHDGLQARLDWLRDEVGLEHEAPAIGAQIDPRLNVLRRWWLDLFAAGFPFEDLE